MLLIVWVSWDAPSIALAFAWKLRCADISITSSSVISTFERSSAPERTAPIEPLVGPSIVGGPLSPVDCQCASPVGRRPDIVGKVAIATLPSVWPSPLAKVAVTRPSRPLDTLHSAQARYAGAPRGRRRS